MANIINHQQQKKTKKTKKTKKNLIPFKLLAAASATDVAIKK